MGMRHTPETMFRHIKKWYNSVIHSSDVRSFSFQHRNYIRSSYSAFCNLVVNWKMYSEENQNLYLGLLIGHHLQVHLLEVLQHLYQHQWLSHPCKQKKSNTIKNYWFIPSAWTSVGWITCESHLETEYGE